MIQGLLHIYTEIHATFPIQIDEITVEICGNFWGTQCETLLLKKPWSSDRFLSVDCYKSNWPFLVVRIKNSGLFGDGDGIILDGYSEIGAHVCSVLDCLICLRHLIRSRAVTNLIILRKWTFSLHACTTYSEFPYNISTMVKGMTYYLSQGCVSGLGLNRIRIRANYMTDNCDILSLMNTGGGGQI